MMATLSLISPQTGRTKVLLAPCSRPTNCKTGLKGNPERRCLYLPQGSGMGTGEGPCLPAPRTASGPAGKEESCLSYHRPSHQAHSALRSFPRKERSEAAGCSLPDTPGGPPRQPLKSPGRGASRGGPSTSPPRAKRFPAPVDRGWLPGSGWLCRAQVGGISVLCGSVPVQGDRARTP